MFKVTPAKQKITYLGHAGWMIETDEALILMDPWLSETGAYEYAWFQYPCNHHLADMVRQKVKEVEHPRLVFVYVSHEHLDHFDPDFLLSLETKYGGQPTLVIADLTRKRLYNWVQENWHSKNYRIMKDSQRLVLNYQSASYLEFYIHDSGRETDSAVLFHNPGFNFLNMNDCHIHDRVAEIQEKNGHLNILTGHFSGASWFPTCYTSNSFKGHAKAAKRNKYSRLSALCKLVEDIKPGRYIPSAGPACFLDADVFHLNFQEDTIFPQASEFYDFWRRWKGNLDATRFDYRAPGDKVFYTMPKVPPFKTKRGLKRELITYAKKMRRYRNLKRWGCRLRWRDTAGQLAMIMSEKLDRFPLRHKIPYSRPLLLRGVGEKHMVVVDFYLNTVSIAPDESRQRYRDRGYYEITATAQVWQDITWEKLSWYEWLLSFRFQIDRKPNEFNPVLDGFLVCEADEFEAFYQHYKERTTTATIVVHTDSKTYKVCSKCPHEGADLSHGWVDGNHLVCAKHGWRFDLEDGGKCDIHDSTINAVEVIDEQHPSPQA